MKRYAFELSYNGRDYFGWQRQPHQVSIQEEIENALTKLNRNQSISVTGCGRTDTGVHAFHYVLHVDLPEHFPVEDLSFRLNKMLTKNIAIHSIKEVSSSFHARFDAVGRTYRYFVHQQKNPFKNDTSLFFPEALDIDAMNKAAGYLIGKKDFTSFSKLHTDVKTNICDVMKAVWIQTGSNELYFEIKADRFLRNMVRATVGTLLEVGTGKLSPADILPILEKKDRCEAKMSVPGHALFLWEINY